MNNYILKGCQRCGGDLARDWGDWICLQCGAYCYIGLYRTDSRPQRTAAMPPIPAAPPNQPGLPEVRLHHTGGDLPVRTDRLTAAAAIPARRAAPAGGAVLR